MDMSTGKYEIIYIDGDLRKLKLLILDRDGVINRNSIEPDSPYYNVLRPLDFIFLPNVLGAFVWMKHWSCHVCICTRQRCVGRGQLTLEALDEIHKEMNRHIRIVGGNPIRNIFIEIEEESKIGPLKKAMETYGVAPEECLFLDDDREHIEEAEKELGIPGIVITAEHSLRSVVRSIIESEDLNVYRN